MAVRYLNATGTQALIDEIKNRLAQKANQTSIDSINTRLTQITDSIPTDVSQLNNDAGYLDQAAADELYYDKTNGETLSIAVQQHTTALATLNADAETEGSVDYKIKQVLADGVAVATLNCDDETQLEEGLYALAEKGVNVAYVTTTADFDSLTVLPSTHNILKAQTMLAVKVDQGSWRVQYALVDDDVMTILLPARSTALYFRIEIESRSITKKEIEEVWND